MKDEGFGSDVLGNLSSHHHLTITCPAYLPRSPSGTSPQPPRWHPQCDSVALALKKGSIVGEDSWRT